MAHILTNYGEEYFIQNGLDSGTTEWMIGLYDDASVGTSGDAIGETDDVAAITTEPDRATAYARQGATFSPTDLDADAAGLTEASVSDTAETFDLSGVNTGTIDSWFLVISFQATGEAGANNHLIATGALSKEYSLDSVDTLDLNAGGAGISVD